ncbi:Outer membrane porin F precursor [compost metagenome]|jgi:outer membrane protein OmpA-like peptidoglycan-associated protein
MSAIARYRGLLLVIVGLFAGLAADSTWSESSNNLSVDEMVQQLKGDGGSDVGQMRTRSLRPGAAAKATTMPSTASDAPAGGLLSLQVQFDFGSAQLSQSSYAVLQKLAKALASGELKNYSFSVVGHTDAVGSAAYNLELSRQRASSVKAYLVNQGVQAARITSDGKGFSQLLDANSPKNPINRRVEVTAKPS